jgi:hypothetical protein
MRPESVPDLQERRVHVRHLIITIVPVMGNVFLCPIATIIIAVQEDAIKATHIPKALAQLNALHRAAQ